MRNGRIAAFLAVAVMAAAGTIMLTHKATAQETPVVPKVLPNEATTLAKSFAPWIKAIARQRLNVADKYYHLRRQPQDLLETPDVASAFNRFSNLNGLDLNLIAVRPLGKDTGIALFTLNADEGPVMFKIYYYQSNGENYVGHLQIEDAWDAIEETATTVEPLPHIVTVPLNEIPDEKGDNTPAPAPETPPPAGQ